MKETVFFCLDDQKKTVTFYVIVSEEYLTVNIELECKVQLFGGGFAH